MLFTRLPRTASGHTTVVLARWDTTARWLPSITFSPVNEPTCASNERSETVAVTNDRPPSADDARTTSASLSSLSPLRS